MASKVFQSMYNKATYGGGGGDPPSPMIFLGLLPALDLAYNAAVVALLFTAMHFFKAPDNEFPIDKYMMMQWLLDYVATTGINLLLGAVIGTVIKDKKYFRYKYEGDRGIRAMQSMVFDVYCVVLPIPFFRLAS